MTWLESFRTRLRNGWLRYFVLPALNRELRAQDIHLYRYSAEADRLSAHREFYLRDMERSRNGRNASDRWYAALRERNLNVAVAVDIGANIGFTSAWISGWAEQVYSFEPSPRNAVLIREQMQIRGITNVELSEVAVSDQEGETTLFVKRDPGHHSLGDIGASATRDQISVQLTTLDREMKKHGVDRIGFLKVDVEGFETEVFRGASELLKAKAIDLVLFEYSPRFYLQRGLDAQAPLRVLEEFGYVLSTIHGDPVDRKTLDAYKQIDLLAEPASG